MAKKKPLGPEPERTTSDLSKYNLRLQGQFKGKGEVEMKTFTKPPEPLQAADTPKLEAIVSSGKTNPRTNQELIESMAETPIKKPDVASSSTAPDSPPEQQPLPPKMKEAIDIAHENAPPIEQLVQNLVERGPIQTDLRGESQREVGPHGGRRNQAEVEPPQLRRRHQQPPLGPAMPGTQNLRPPADVPPAVPAGPLPQATWSSLGWAAVGHLKHQAIAVGLPTLAREVVAQALAVGFNAAPREVTLGIQFGVSAAQVAQQAVRVAADFRNVEEAARGMSAMSPQEWQALPQEGRDKRINAFKALTLATVGIQLAAISTRIVTSNEAFNKNDTATLANGLVTDVKLAAYALARDGIQSQYAQVGLPPGANSYGLPASQLPGPAVLYGISTAISNMVGGFIGNAADISEARSVLQGTAEASTSLATPAAAPAARSAAPAAAPTPGPMGAGRAAGKAILMAVVSTVINTVVEALDFFTATQREASLAGTRQEYGNRPVADVERLADATAIRASAIGASLIAGNLSSFAEQYTKNPAVKTVISSAFQGVMAAATYIPITVSWQASSNVRASVIPPDPVAPPVHEPPHGLPPEGGDIEQGHVA